MIKKINAELGRDFFIYGLSFLLLLEWILPLPEIANTGYMSLIFLMTVLFFMMTFLRVPVVISLLIKTLIIGYSVCLIFWGGQFFSTKWLFAFLIEVQANLGYIFSGKWYALTDVFRSFLFFVLLAIMSYLLYFWTVQVRKIMFFLFFTIVYIAVIDTFTTYDASFAIIRIFIIGFTLLGLVTIYRRIETENSQEDVQLIPVRLAVLLVMMITAGSVFGFLLPKMEPQWEDPVPFMKAAIGIEEVGQSIGNRKIGYGDNDEHLGGGFADDATPVFYAMATEDHYWRGETKDYYTGKGWSSTTPFVEGREPYTSTEEEIYDAEVIFAGEVDRYSHLFYPGRLLTQNEIMNIGLSLDFFSTKARTFLDGAPVNLSRYNYEYMLPKYSIKSLRQSGTNDPEYVNNYYKQLPDIPERVSELAARLIEGHDNRYDQVKAIEAYLTSSNFKYETKNVPIPDDQQDYVDQFLFESQRGYCDNFSTSMIVMLRSQDIPARWAKGFTQGEKIEQSDHDRHIYEVTNGNAHSWVEVYFPNAGWIPFEPTKGFVQPYDIVDEELTELEDERADIDTNEEPEVEETEDEHEKQEERIFFSEKINRFFPMIVLMMIVGTLLYFIFKSKKVSHYFLYRRFERREDEEAFVQAYEQLLLHLKKYKLERKYGETLREYAERIDDAFSTEAMRALTAEYEKVIYGKQDQRNSWEEQRENWLKFMKELKS